ncbi:hypothetical protein CIB48_g3630 [Xylaria polymorpha]|nr:hypothetical protein CIB48_g3630 [Xylaria polymorpha]
MTSVRATRQLDVATDGLRQAKTDISAQFEISPAVMTSQQIWIPIKWERLESRCLLVHRLSDDGPGLCMGESPVATSHSTTDHQRAAKHTHERAAELHDTIPYILSRTLSRNSRQYELPATGKVYSAVQHTPGPSTLSVVASGGDVVFELSNRPRERRMRAGGRRRSGIAGREIPAAGDPLSSRGAGLSSPSLALRRPGSSGLCSFRPSTARSTAVLLYIPGRGS